MSATQAVIFDLDDTLYPERAYAFSGFAAVAETFKDVLSDPAWATDRMRQLFDTPERPRVFNALLRECDREPDRPLITRMVNAFRTHHPTITLHCDADAALTRYRRRFRLGLITDGPAVTQRNKTEALGLRTRFDKIILTDDLGPGRAKPHPRAFELIAEEFGVGASRCTYVGDNASKDFVAPNALGWMTIQIVRSDGIYCGELPPSGGTPNHVVDTLDDLDKWLA